MALGALRVAEDVGQLVCGVGLAVCGGSGVESSAEPLQGDLALFRRVDRAARIMIRPDKERRRHPVTYHCVR
ncbi:hypothetical protein GCM10022206_17890 [Streptomyces chiangmaiensis]